jgi:HTH-type transcriptional regulator / antitoxin HipB
MIQNEHQYRITQSKLLEFERKLADLDPQDPNLHPRQVIGWTNSYKLTIRQLKQELSEYEQLKSGNILTSVTIPSDA